MASLELMQTVRSYDNFIETNGITEEIIDLYCSAAEVAIVTEKDMEYGLKLTEKAKSIIEKFTLHTVGANIWALEHYAQDNAQHYEIIDKYYKLLKLESYEKLDSFIYYMERKRHYSKRFYYPRRKTLGIVVKDLEGLENRKYKFYGLSLPSRVGKALAYDTPVLTENGWKNHGDLTIRDRVIGMDGEFKKILAIHNPCEMEYRVTFADGESIVCHGNHEWVVFDHHLQKDMTYETKFLAENLCEKDSRLRMYAPTAEDVQGSHKALWVDPYTLGAWLGDGRNQNPDICGAESDYAVVQRILDAGYPLAWDTKHKTTGVRYYGFRGLREQLQKYGMCHSRRKTAKHIPEEYLTANEEQRLELLAGLLDTDGTLIRSERRYHFTTADFALKEDFVSLISTFGWRASVAEIPPKVSSSEIAGKKTYWVIGFSPTKHIPCQLELELPETLNQVEKYISEIQDSHIRRIIHFRIIEGLS